MKKRKKIDLGEVDRVKYLGCLGKEPSWYFISPLEVSKKVVLYCHGRNKWKRRNDGWIRAMLLSRYLLEEKEKKHSLAIHEMGDRQIDLGQKLKEKRDENRNGLCWLERKKVSRWIFLHLP